MMDDGGLLVMRRARRRMRLSDSFLLQSESMVYELRLHPQWRSFVASAPLKNAASSAPKTAVQRKGIAVLPFENRRGQENGFRDGIQDDLVTDAWPGSGFRF